MGDTDLVNAKGSEFGPSIKSERIVIFGGDFGEYAAHR